MRNTEYSGVVYLRNM